MTTIALVFAVATLTAAATGLGALPFLVLKGKAVVLAYRRRLGVTGGFRVVVGQLWFRPAERRGAARVIWLHVDRDVRAG